MRSLINCMATNPAMRKSESKSWNTFATIPIPSSHSSASARTSGAQRGITPKSLRHKSTPTEPPMTTQSRTHGSNTFGEAYGKHVVVFHKGMTLEFNPAPEGVKRPKIFVGLHVSAPTFQSCRTCTDFDHRNSNTTVPSGR
jgi:hypothetical protein